MFQTSSLCFILLLAAGWSHYAVAETPVSNEGWYYKGERNPPVVRVSSFSDATARAASQGSQCEATPGDVMGPFYQARVPIKPTTRTFCAPVKSANVEYITVTGKIFGIEVSLLGFVADSTSGTAWHHGSPLLDTQPCICSCNRARAHETLHGVISPCKCCIQHLHCLHGPIILFNGYSMMTMHVPSCAWPACSKTWMLHGVYQTSAPQWHRCTACNNIIHVALCYVAPVPMLVLLAWQRTHAFASCMHTSKSIRIKARHISG